MRYDLNGKTPYDQLPDANWDIIPEYMHGAVARYVVHGIEPGDFLGAVIENDLMRAAGKADDTNANCLFQWASFLYTSFPRGSYGSPETRKEWQKAGGMSGIGERQ